MGAIFSEFTPLDVLVSRETTTLLKRAELLVYVAFPPELRTQAAPVIGRLRDADLAVGLWPLLADHGGRWANVWNGVEFADYCRDMLDELSRLDLLPDEFLLDLEPPIDVVRQMLRGRFPRRPPNRAGGAALVRLVADTKPLCPVVATVVPWIFGGGGGGWQRALGTPHAQLGADRTFVMAYSSMVEGYSRGILARSDAEALVDHWARELRAAVGDRAAVAVGVAGVGALGDEPTYREPSELARDASIARAAGCQHLALFNLAGVLARRDPTAWLKALQAREPIEPAPLRLRVRALIAALSGAGRIMELRRPELV